MNRSGGVRPAFVEKEHSDPARLVFVLKKASQGPERRRSLCVEVVAESLRASGSRR
jgi:hypothetical protein